VNPLPSEIAQVSFADWKSRLADALVIGQAQRLPDGRFEVRFRLLDVPKQAQIGGVAYTLTAAQVRLTAHKIADFIYEKLTGERGVFSTRIAYVVKQGATYELRVADADGQNAQSILKSQEPIMSPAWSPEGTRMAYVSFQNKKPILFVQNLSASKQPAPVANYRGSNSAPAWAPDGKQLAAVLTRDGTSQIYLMNADGGNLRRLTTSSAIDTNHFSPPMVNRSTSLRTGAGARRSTEWPRAGRPGASDLRWRLQRFAARQPGRQDPRVHFAHQRALPADGNGPREPAGPGPDRRPARRVAQLRAERPDHSLCIRQRQPRRACGGIERRPLQAAARNPAADIASPPGALYGN